MLKPIKHSSVSEQIYTQIRDLIFRGQLRPGERLLPERKMANALGVGRPAVREAVQRLTHNGLVKTRRGAGTFVLPEESRRDSKSLLQILDDQEFTIEEFLEVRMALECNGAALAAKRATEQDIRLIEDNVRKMREEMKVGNRDFYEDLSFHMNISYSTRNIVQINLMRSFHDVMYSGLKVIFTNLFRIPGLDPEIFQQHVGILEAIRKRDPDLANKAMKDHISIVIEKCRELEL